MIHHHSCSLVRIVGRVSSESRIDGDLLVRGGPELVGSWRKVLSIFGPSLVSQRLKVTEQRLARRRYPRSGKFPAAKVAKACTGMRKNGKSGRLQPNHVRLWTQLVQTDGPLKGYIRWKFRRNWSSGGGVAAEKLLLESGLA